MKFYNITDVRAFFERVLRCEGRVMSLGRDGGTRDLKRVAREMLASGMADRIDGIREISLAVERPGDRGLLLDYAVQIRDRRVG